jgi:serine protease AprX
VQAYTIDPLAYAAEVAWRAGITVVVAAGNAGMGWNKLNNPAYDPFVIAVGAANTYGQTSCTAYLCPVASFSESGDGVRNPDFLAPGQSISSLDVPGSALDTAFPAARQGTRFFRGSGTSQATAVVSGAAALLAQRYPTATPDQIKYLLKSGASGSGVSTSTSTMDLQRTWQATLPSAATSAQTFTRSTGTGSLELSRGTTHLVDNGTYLSGEKDIMGRAFNASTWAAGAGSSNWNGGVWNGTRWTGDGWSGTRWTSAAWSGSAWSGTLWSSVTYSGTRWTGGSWTGSSFSGTRWTGTRWTSNNWSSAGWG